MKPYLIFLDMDGTLLKSNQTLSSKTIDIIRELSSKGHKIIISSGRPLRGVKEYYDILSLKTPLILYNGGSLISFDDPSFPKVDKLFPKELIISLIDEIGKEYLQNVICETHEDIYYLNNDDSLDRYFPKKNMMVHVGNFKKILDQDCYMVLIKIKQEKYQSRIKDIVESHEGLKLRFWSGKYLEVSEIYFDGVTKGRGVSILGDYFSIPYERRICFGDALNDLEMFKRCKYSFCMKNGEEELKSISYKVTQEDNNHDGIYLELKDFDFDR